MGTWRLAFPLLRGGALMDQDMLISKGMGLRMELATGE